MFLYLATRPHPWDYRLFLLRHVSLLKGLPEWRIRVLLPQRLRKAKALYHGAFLDQLVRTLDPWVVEQLMVFFKACRTGGGHVSAPVDPYLAKVYQRFGAIRFRALYKTWRRLGDIATGSIAHGALIRDAYQRGEGGVEYQELRPQSLQLTARIAHDHGPRRGDKRRTRAVVPPSDGAPPPDPPTALVTS